MITNHEADILRHASNNDGRYVTEESAALSLSERGYFQNRGRWALAGGAYALMLTISGREALNEWKREQPKPTVKKRRVSNQFAAWRSYRDSYYHNISFRDFLREIWPKYTMRTGHL